MKVPFLLYGLGRADLIAYHAALADILSPDRLVVLPFNSAVRAHQPALLTFYAF